MGSSPALAGGRPWACRAHPGRSGHWALGARSASCGRRACGMAGGEVLQTVSFPCAGKKLELA
eukprot:4048676-Alexandrium_andersonii.AAC.1